MHFKRWEAPLINKKLKYDLLLLLVVINWSAAIPLTKNALNYIDVLPMLAIRYSMGALLMWSILLIRRKKIRKPIDERTNDLQK